MPIGDVAMRRQESLGYQVNHLARLLAMRLKEQTIQHGVVPGQFAQLLALYEHDGVSAAELCETVQVDQSTMANTLQRMERDQLIRRDVDTTDRRRAVIRLTDRARRLERPLVGGARQVNRVATAGLTRAEVNELMRMIAVLIGNLEDSESASPLALPAQTEKPRSR